MLLPGLVTTATNFAYHVNSRLRQYDPWKALHGKHVSGNYPSDSEMSLRSPKHVWPMDGIFTAIASPNSPNGGFNRLRLPTLPHRLPQPPIACPPL